MNSFDRSRNMSSTALAVQPFSFHTANHFAADAPRLPAITSDSPADADKPDSNIAFMKGPKRKRLSKACDACHKSKRRCDGSAPCSNCYFASKACTYTDGSGRPVPAPRAFKAGGPEPPTNDNTRQTPGYGNHTAAERFPHGTPHATRTPNSYSGVASSSSLAADLSEEDHANSRKRFRPERGNVVGPADLPMDSGSSVTTLNNHQNDRPPELDHALTRELVNCWVVPVFHRSIIHKPTFSAALSHSQVPSYLVHAVCAMAAPLSKQPRVRTTPARCAGKFFAQEAISRMFDSSGCLTCEPNLATAQALCLLQISETISKQTPSMQYHDMALQIVEKLGVHKPDNPTLTPVPTPEFIQEKIDKECIRRIFWLIHLMDIQASIYFQKPLIPKDNNQLLLRLPADETSFEIRVDAYLPEYIYLPAPDTKYASEFAHLIRVYTIYGKLAALLEVLNGPETKNYPVGALLEAEQALDAWALSLPEHLRFSEDSLQVQLSMLETSSNAGAWFFCYMHSVHASCALAMNIAKQRVSRGKPEPSWAATRLDVILTTLGPRAKNSCLMGSSLYALIKFCKRDDQQMRTWAAEYEEVWGVNVHQVAMQERERQHQQSPHAQHAQQQRQNSHSNVVALSRSQYHRDSAGGVDVSYPPGRAHSSSPSAYPNMGRSFTELRLNNNRPAHAMAASSMNDKARIADADIDPALQNGAAASQRNHAMSLGDSSQSLPSLKASGLLDSWSSSKDNPAGSGRDGAWTTVVAHSRGEAQKQHAAHQRPSPPRAPPPAVHFMQDEYSKAGTGGMPVGLQWLANEAR